MQRSPVPHWWPAAAGLGASSVSATGEGEPQPGGTLIVAGDPDVLWMDPAAAYSAADYQFQRMTLRGLFDYPNSGTLEERATPLPDLAVEVPTQENGGSLRRRPDLHDRAARRRRVERRRAATRRRRRRRARRQADVQPGAGLRRPRLLPRHDRRPARVLRRVRRGGARDRADPRVHRVQRDRRRHRRRRLARCSSR